MKRVKEKEGWTESEMWWLFWGKIRMSLASVLVGDRFTC